MVERGGQGRSTGRSDVSRRPASVEPSGLVVVANRLPVQPDTTDSVVRWSPSPGGVASALTSVLREHDGIWVGWTGDSERRDAPSVVDGTRLRSVHLSARDYEEFYLGFSNAAPGPSTTTRSDPLPSTANGGTPTAR